MNESREPVASSSSADFQGASIRQSVNGNSAPAARLAGQCQQGSFELKCCIDKSFDKNSRSPVSVHTTSFTCPPQSEVPANSACHECAGQSSPLDVLAWCCPLKQALRLCMYTRHNAIAVPSSRMPFGIIMPGIIFESKSFDKRDLQETIKMELAVFRVYTPPSPCSRSGHVLSSQPGSLVIGAMKANFGSSRSHDSQHARGSLPRICSNSCTRWFCHRASKTSDGCKTGCWVFPYFRLVEGRHIDGQWLRQCGRRTESAQQVSPRILEVVPTRPT